MQGAPTYLERGGNSSFENFRPGVISTSPVKRYPKVLSRFDIAFMQVIGRRLMSAYDYEPDSLSFTPGDWLQFIFVHLPLDFLRMVGWYAKWLYENSGRVELPAYHLLPRKTGHPERKSLSKVQ